MVASGPTKHSEIKVDTSSATCQPPELRCSPTIELTPAAASKGQRNNKPTPMLRTKKSTQMTKIRPRFPFVRSELRDIASVALLFSRIFTGTARDHIKANRIPGTIKAIKPKPTPNPTSVDSQITPPISPHTLENDSITLAGRSR